MGLGDLRSAGLVDQDRIKQDKEDAYARLDRLKVEMMDLLGVEEPPMPNEPPEPLTSVDLEVMSHRALGAYHTKYVGYLVFIGSKLAEIEIMEREAGKHLKKVKAEISVELRTAGNSEAKVKDLVLLHPIYREAELEHEKLYCMKKIITSYHDGYKEVAKALSRNVTIREIELEHQKRQDNVGKSKGASPSRRRNNFGPKGRR